MADNTFMLEIVTPEQILFKDEVQFLVVPEMNGELGVLKNHAPLLAALQVGVLRYTDASGSVRKVAVGGGFMEVIYNEARVLAETAERGDEVDVIRARSAKERAERRIAERDENINYSRAKMSLHKAISRLKAANALEDKK